MIRWGDEIRVFVCLIGLGWEKGTGGCAGGRVWSALWVFEMDVRWMEDG